MYKCEEKQKDDDTEENRNAEQNMRRKEKE
jgi:hypothetical protein